MKITDLRRKPEVGPTLGSRQPGSCFMYRDALYMATDEITYRGVRVVRLTDGKGERLPRETEVTPVLCSLEIRDCG